MIELPVYADFQRVGNSGNGWCRRQQSSVGALCMYEEKMRGVVSGLGFHVNAVASAVFVYERDGRPICHRDRMAFHGE